MSKHTIDCWSCGTTASLDEISEADGYCPRCDAEIDLGEYLEPALSERDTLIAEVERLTAEVVHVHSAHQLSIESHRKTWNQLEQAKREIAQLKGEGQ